MSTQITQPQSGIQLINPPDQPISDQSLSQYGRQLKFDEKYLKKANDVCKKVCDVLKSSEFKPERFSVSESHVCQEGVEDTGVDVVAYLKEGLDMNKAKTKYNEDLNKMGAQRSSMDDKGVMHFELDNVKVNLGFSVSRGPTVGEHRKAVFQQITKLDKEGKLQKEQVEKVSVDLHDSMNEFMNQNRDEFDLAAQRLARAWRRTAVAPWSDWFSPLDSMLVMQNALAKERQRGTGSLEMVNVMRQFLNDLSNIESMQVTFPEASLYDWAMVPQWIQQERPLLLDPVNPFRNTFSGLNRTMFKEIKQQASEALKMIEQGEASMRQLFNVPPEAVQRGA